MSKAEQAAEDLIEQLTDKLERRDKHIMILEELIDVLTQERDELKETVEEFNIINGENYQSILILKSQLSAEKQNNEELKKLVEKIYSSTNVYENNDAVRRIQYDISQHSKLNK
tara:strand:- start:257 stop:598 length:342 start_codon:yes stop_codon:yes gene_type:complete